MNKIEFPRKTYDGVEITETELQEWYVGRIKKEIEDAITELIKKTTAKKELKCLKDIKKILLKILLAKPEQLLLYKDEFDKKYIDILREKKKDGSYSEYTTSLCKSILKAFNYDEYRKGVLIELAKKINVKTCPYCNMHYTLFAESNDPKDKDLSKFQYDHFVDKSQYPQLSMSLYNLIPSCAVCNQGKSTAGVSVKFNPYHSAINKQFHFEVETPVPLLSGSNIADKIKVDIIADEATEEELSAFQSTFNIKSLYSRHGDLAQEIFDKAYESVYYENAENFKYLKDASPEYLKQLWLGTYTSEGDIEKRPMTKFAQDLWKQAKGEK